MGTRHLISVFSEGEYKVAQYGQWDGYPSGQGIDVLNFLRRCNTKVFKEKVKNCKYIEDAKLSEYWKEFGEADEHGFISSKIADEFYLKYPQFNRDMGSKILSFVYESDGEVELVNSIDFANDSLFCEWGYVIDLDSDTFEVFSGFKEGKLDSSERFYNNGAFNKEEYGKQDTYYPISLVGKFEFKNLPSDEEFLSTFKADDEE